MDIMGLIFTPPKVGDHSKVTGAYIIDVREDGHAEIHPASLLVVMSHNIT